MATAPTTLGQIVDLTDLSVQKIFIKSSDPEVMYDKYFNFRTTEDLYEKDSSITGLGKAGFLDENAALTSDTPILGYKQTYTQNSFGLVLPITFKAWRLGFKRRDLENIVDELKRAMARLKEQMCADRLDNGVSTTYTFNDVGGARSITISGGDGLQAFTSAHTREDGGTNMNNGVYDGTTYNLPLDYAGLKAAYRTASLMVDGRGNPRPAMLDTLVVKKGSTNHLKAMEILGAIKNGRIPESFDNDAAGAWTFKILALDYLANAGYWYMFDSSRALTDREGFQFIENMPTTLDNVNVVYKTKEMQFSVTALFDLGFNDVARCWVFSKGDSTVLS